jgi:hypothetical protein
MSGKHILALESHAYSRNNLSTPFLGNSHSLFPALHWKAKAAELENLAKP